jgi:hypothetical protein
VKKAKNTKMDHIVLEGISRVEFVKAFFRIHDVADKFSPGIHSGPDFKFWWTGRFVDSWLCFILLFDCYYVVVAVRVVLRPSKLIMSSQLLLKLYSKRIRQNVKLRLNSTSMEWKVFESNMW